MLFISNNIVAVARMVEISWKSSYVSYSSWTVCYIWPASFEVAVNIDWENTSDVFTFYSNNIDINIWDKFTDKNSLNYKVKWIQKYDDMLWKHSEWILLKTYD